MNMTPEALEALKQGDPFEVCGEVSEVARRIARHSRNEYATITVWSEDSYLRAILLGRKTRFAEDLALGEMVIITGTVAKGDADNNVYRAESVVPVAAHIERLLKDEDEDWIAITKEATA